MIVLITMQHYKIRSDKVKKVILLIIIVLFISGCSIKDSRGLYKIKTYESKDIYSDEVDPMMVSDGKIVSIKKFLTKSNCVLSCIYNNKEQFETLENGINIIILIAIIKK